MTIEEELSDLREQVGERDGRIQQLEAVVERQNTWIEQLQEQISRLSQEVKAGQERQGKNSHNSHLPPSSDRFVRQPKSLRTKSEKPSGGQEGHPGTTLAFSDEADEVIEHHVKTCAFCQQDVQAVAACGIERRQVVDITSPRVLVQEHRAEQKQCPNCQQITVAPFPQGVRAPIQYGPRLGAIAVYLMHQHLLPLARTVEVLHDVLGVHLSEGTLCELTRRCGCRLVEVEQHIKEALRQAEVIHQDESGLYVAGKRQWLHVTCTSTLTHYQLHRSRGRAALNAIGILPQFAGVSIHDGWAAYFLYACTHACCNVHVLRELTYLAEEQGLWWAAKLKALLFEMKEATEQAREQGKLALHPLEVADWEARFLELLAEGDRVHPHAQAPPGHRGRVKQSPARNLLDRLRKDQQAFLCFLEDLRVDFDNNQAERDVRMIKVQQKISGCFRSVAGAEVFCRIRGYLSTLRKQGLPLLSALQATLSGHPVLPSLERT